MARPLLVVSGTYRQPELRAFFSRNAPHPRVPGKGLIDLMKSFDSAYFRKDRSRGDHWFISGLGRFDADRVFDRAGFDIDFESETYDTDLEGVDTLDELVDPIMKLASDRRMVLVRPRLLGFKKSKELLGSGAMWDKGRQRFYMPVGDLIKRGEPRPDLDIPEDALEAAWEQHERVHTDDDLLSQASKAALAKDVVDLTEDEIAALIERVGDVPEWFGLPLYPYQRVGALAVAAGHNLLADGMRVGKALGVHSKVLTPRGYTTMGRLSVGDLVIGSNGHGTEVTGIFPQGKRTLYSLRLSDGSVVQADGEHLWTVTDENGVTATLTTIEIEGRIANGSSFALPELSPVHYDGTRYAARRVSPPQTPDSVADWGYLLGMGDWDAAEVYEFASVEMRQAVIEGAKSSRGVTSSDDFEAQWEFRSWRAAEMLMTIARSLGRVVTSRTNRGSAHTTMTVTLHHLGTERKIVSVRSEERDVEMVCISVAAKDSLFVIDSFVLTHNTRTGLAVAAMRGSERTLIICPPVVLTNWQRNVDECLLATLGGQNPEGKVIEFRTGRKEPELPDAGVVIISDSLMTSRQHIQDALVEWAPSVVIYDEGHRAKNFESARTGAVLRVAAASDFAVPMTGTPLFQTPQELAPLLEMTGHLTPIFGGLDEFMETYCVQNKWGGWAPRMKSLPELRKMLDTYVWVRRTKDQVLKDLPKVSRGDIDIDIDLKLFNAAHREVSEKVVEWIEDFYEDFGRLPSHEHTNGKGKVVDEIAEFAREHGIEFISKLRRAAGLAKVPTAVEYIKEHVYSTTEVVNGRKVFTRPLLVWTYHTEVSEEMSEVVPNEVDDAAIIMGGISQNKRQRLIDEFQEGKIPVLVCQISAAGVGIDLTRSSDAIFVETDWVNALVQQAEERVQGVNQKRPVMLTTMVARGTLDDRIQRVLHEKSKILDPLLGGKNDVSVVEVDDEAASSSAVLIEIIDNELRKYKKGRR